MRILEPLRVLAAICGIAALAGCVEAPKGVYQVADGGYQGYLAIASFGTEITTLCHRQEPNPPTGRDDHPDCTEQVDFTNYLDHDAINGDGQKFQFGIGSAGGHGHVLLAKCTPACRINGPYENLTLRATEEQSPETKNQIPHYPRPFEVVGNKILLNTVDVRFRLEAPFVTNVNSTLINAQRASEEAIATVKLVRSAGFQVDPLSWVGNDVGGLQRRVEQAYLRIADGDQLVWVRRPQAGVPAGCSSNDFRLCDDLPPQTVVACAGAGCTPVPNGLSRPATSIAD